MKRCKGCGLKKSLKQFRADSPKCKDCAPASKRRRRRAQGEKQSKADRQKRLEALRKRVREWKEQNPELYEHQQRKAEQKERARGYPTSAKKRALMFDAFEEIVDKRILFELFEGHCGICGQTVEYKDATIDHIVPLSKGGKHSYANTQIAHAPCNRRKADKLPGLDYERLPNDDAQQRAA